LVEPYVPDSGDLIWLDFNPQVGHEQAGRRPGLVLSSRRFNKKASLAYVCPVTSKIRGYASEVRLPAGLPVNGVVLCSHLRSVDWQVRNPKMICKAPDSVLRVARDIVASIAGIAP
jgi:mRNA interferase MazF